MDLSIPLTLSEEFNYTLNLLERTKTSAFITGRAGTGKSTLLGLFRNTTKKKTVVLAPTGIAALNVKGQTIHSFFGFPPKMIDKSDIRKRKNARSYQKVEVIIIDEISMVRADMLDNIDYFLRVNRDVDEPFGGVQMIFFGDLFQLPPVVASQVERQYFRERYESAYFFSSDVITNGYEYEIIELNQVFRQSEMFFIKLLDRIRTRSFDQDDLDVLNERVAIETDEDSYHITLCSRNNIANQINQDRMRKLEGDERSYMAKVEGQFNPRLFPTDPVLNIKVGSQVMFIKNDPQKRFVNGTIGKVLSVQTDQVFVVVRENDEVKTIEIEAMEWEIMKYDLSGTEIKTKVAGSYTQIPLKLAWAITIHKSQGKTFENVIIDLGGGAFEYGQAYVALSRCKTLGGIILKNPLRPQDVIVDDHIIEFYDTKRYYL